MKKLAILSLFLCFGIQSQSQILITLLLGDKLNSDGLEFGLDVGFNVSSLSGLETKKPLTNLNLGFYFDIRLKNNWYMYTGCLVKANAGAIKLTDNDLDVLNATKYEGEIDGILIEGDYSQEMNYFMVPILLKYRFDNNFYVELGPQAGLMYKSYVQFDSDIEGREATIKEFNTDDLNTIDIGGAAGVGYKLPTEKGWTIGIRYYYGFTNVYKETIIPSSNNRGVFAKLNIPIGAGKAKAKREAEATEKVQ
jgi:hypothetical protein